MLRASLALSASLLLSALASTHAFAFDSIPMVPSQQNAAITTGEPDVTQPGEAPSLEIVDAAGEEALDTDRPEEKVHFSPVILWGSAAAITVYATHGDHSHADASLVTTENAGNPRGSDVPEPATIFLLGGGLLGLAGFRRKK